MGYFVALFSLLVIAYVIAGVPFMFLPDNQVFTIADSLMGDVVGAFFTVIFTIFYINFDANRPTPSEKANGELIITKHSATGTEKKPFISVIKNS